MKALKCYDCESEFKADTKEEILGHLYDHYMKDHKETIVGADDSEKKRWMEQFEKDWAAA
jgi:predicted small metal-binding protein